MHRLWKELGSRWVTPGPHAFFQWIGSSKRDFSNLGLGRSSQSSTESTSFPCRHNASSRVSAAHLLHHGISPAYFSKMALQALEKTSRQVNECSLRGYGS